MNALRNFRIWQKLSAVVVLMAIPLGFMTWAYVTSASSQIAFAEKEITGTQYLRPLRSLAQRMAEHRGLNAAYLSGSTGFGARIEASAAHIERIIAEIDTTPAEVVETLDAAARWSAIKSAWRSLEQGRLELAAVDNFDRHSALIGQIIDLSAYVGDTSNLILDPDLDSFYLMDIVVTKLLVLNDMLGVLRGKGTSIASNPALAPQRLRQLDGLDLDGRARDLAAASARSVKTAIRNNATLGTALDGKLAAFEREYESFMRLMKDELFDASVVAVPAAQVFDAGSRAIDAGYAVYDVASPLLEGLLVQRVERMHEQMLVRIGEVALCLVIALALAAWLVTSISRGFARAAALANSVADGNLDNAIDTDGDDEVGQLLRALAAMQAGLRKRRDSDLQVAAEIGRLKQALDNVTANVMVADAEHNIIYMNKAVTALMQEAESDLRQQLKNFDAKRLVGTNIDDFHVNPAHQRDLLSRLTDTHSGSMRIGPRTLRITANPVIDANDERLGTVVEWADLTAELAIEAEVNEIVTAARAGDLSQRIAVAGKRGFYEALSNGINSLVEVVDDTVSDTVRVVGALAAGDLSQSIEREYQGAFGQLKDDTNTTVVKLTQVIGEIKRVAATVRCGAEEISQGNSSLSQRTEQQASSLEETAASMEEMTATVKQNADNANQANQLAVSAREQAEKGGAVVGQAVEAMGGINTASKKIADIISVIDEIAFQTNLLALNAAVEAARAGEQGRGFAVVASEVRNLAQRSATAAKEIKGLIEDSVQRVEGGSKLVQASGETLDGIVTAVKKVSDIIAEIAAASTEQSSGIEQVNRAVMHLDEMTQQNAALVEEAASASQSMGEQARGMVDLVSFFHVADEALAGPQDAVPFATGTTERRGAQRPWTSDGSGAGSAPTGSTAFRRAGADGDDEWEEF